ncbi:thiamine pyrophosphate-dependent enzyme [Proteinivorax tanatarense]|uniref:Indolepyruvate oxidoreductase subunit IorA n=1 Tax=Proteinivorax tanatarense TaxID=1260629 RepID=A0AAU7VNI5_9FIRM
MAKDKKVLTGNQGIAQGFYEAGGKVAASYPGSPTVEILDTLSSYQGVYSEFSTNEKVALEVAIGGSFAGVRSMAVMKHVGVNIAADPLMTFTQTKTLGGFVLVSGDDPGLASSQNEQDNRFFGKFANMGVLDPADSQESLDYTKQAFEISEELQGPMMLRITSRLCHGRSIVNVGERKEVAPKETIADSDDSYCMIPPASKEAQFFMKERLDRLKSYAYDTNLNKLEENGSDTLIITSGLMYNILKEVNPHVDVWKLGLVYPINEEKAKEITANYNKVIVIEEMMPFIEEQLKLMGIECEGKKYFSFTGELDYGHIAKGLKEAGILDVVNELDSTTTDTVERPPLFCSGCPHRPVFDILKKSKTKMVIGDIGCYSMGMQHPFEQSQSIISMGACMGIVKGMSKAFAMQEKQEPLVALIGDGTFFHSGIPGLINQLHQQGDKENITIVVLDNRTTAMTGGQPNASSGLYTKKDDMKVSINELAQSIGFDRVKELDQYDYDETKKIFKEELAHQGLSIIVANGPCALKFKMNNPHYYVDPSICIGCRSCIKTNCPPLKMKEYEGIEKKKSFIDKDMCVGCSICAQVCPVNAIKQSGEEAKGGA